MKPDIMEESLRKLEEFLNSHTKEELDELFKEIKSREYEGVPCGEFLDLMEKRLKEEEKTINNAGQRYPRNAKVQSKIQGEYRHD